MPVLASPHYACYFVFNAILLVPTGPNSTCTDLPLAIKMSSTWWKNSERQDWLCGTLMHLILPKLLLSLCLQLSFLLSFLCKRSISSLRLKTVPWWSGVDKRNHLVFSSPLSFSIFTASLWCLAMFPASGGIPANYPSLSVQRSPVHSFVLPKGMVDHGPLVLLCKGFCD